jgi:hypothetical protein
MPTQTAKFVSAVFAGILATIPLTIASHGETPAPDNCLSSPKGDAPAGNHWFYRIDQSTKRHCWYLRAQGDRISQGAPQNILPSPKPPPQTDTVVQRSLADAHAELPAQTNRNDAPNTDLPPATADWNAAPRANATNANAGSAAMPSSWPQPSKPPALRSPQQRVRHPVFRRARSPRLRRPIRRSFPLPLPQQPPRRTEIGASCHCWSPSWARSRWPVGSSPNSPGRDSLGRAYSARVAVRSGS